MNGGRMMECTPEFLREVLGGHLLIWTKIIHMESLIGPNTVNSNLKQILKRAP